MSSIVLAKQLQKQGKHEEAVALIDNEINEQALKEHLKLRGAGKFELLESRAYSLEKLRKWNSAKDDANEMISLSPRDPRGFLRKGHIYYENGHYGKALQAYRQAVRIVDKTSKLHAKLVLQVEKMKKMATTKYVDPVARLPAELLISIFRQSLNGSMDIVRLMLVSKRWCKYFESEPVYWSQLSFTSDRSIPHQTLDRYMSKSGGRLLHLRVGCLIKKSNAIPRMLKKHANLATLVLDCDSVVLDDLVAEGVVQFPYLGTLKIGCRDLGKMLSWSLENLTSLESLELFQVAAHTSVTRECKNIRAPLKHLSLKGHSNIAQSITKDLCIGLLCLNLESLSLHRVLPEIAGVIPFIKSPQLTKFEFTSCSGKPSGSPFQGVITTPVRHLTLNRVELSSGDQPPLPLEYLEAKWTVFPPDWGISTLIQYFQCSQTLENLILERSSIRFGRTPEEETVYPKLKNLYLVAMPIPVTTQLIEWICRCMPRLQFANFNETPIDGRCIVKLVRHGVKQIRCRNAGSIDPETLTWARDNGSRLILG